MRPAGWRRLFRLREGPEVIAREVDDELDFHIEMRVRKLEARGLSEEAARTEAMRQFGDYSALRGEVLLIEENRMRRARRSGRLREVAGDIGYALRGLRRNRGFAAVVLLSLGVGIGANTAIFTLLDAVFLRELPVTAPEELISIGDPARVNSSTCCTARVDLFSWIQYSELRDAAESVSGLAAMGRTGRLEVTIDGAGATAAENPAARMVSGNYFAVLGVSARLGRTFSETESQVINGAPVVVISDAYWRSRLSADPGAIGRTLRINGSGYAIVGVMSPMFRGEVVGQLTDLWIPITMQPTVMVNEPWLAERGRGWLQLIGRLGPGRTVESARSEFNSLVHAFDDAVSGIANSGAGGTEVAQEQVSVQSAARGVSAIRSAYAQPMTTLMVAVLLVLLVVSANIANLLLARGAARAREIGVRMALGAGRSRLVRQLLTESLVLAVLGGAIGLVFAWWGSRALLLLASAGSQRNPIDAGIDARVLGFATLLSLMTAVLFGLAPALRATRAGLTATTRSAGIEGGGAGIGRQAAPGKVLVIAQIALSLILLVGTSLIVRSTRRLASQDIGLDRDAILMARISFAPAGLNDANSLELYRALLERLGRIPGVAAVTYSENGIFSGTESGTGVIVEGFSPRTAQDTIIFYDRVGPGYFSAIRGRIIAGREIVETDVPNGRRVVLVNETMAKAYFPDGNAVGKRITSDSLTWEVVGVAADTKDHGLRQDRVRRMYVPLVQSVEGLPPVLNYEVRTNGDPLAYIDPVRVAIEEANPSLRVLTIEPLTAMIRRSITQDHLIARVISFFGVLALGLAALGLYGVLSYATLRRTREFGLRLALGAAPADVRAIVMSEALVLVSAGSLLGLPLALASARLLRGQLFGIGVVDPVSIGAAIVVLGCSATLAGLIPALRAARVGPLIALRGD